MPSFALNKGPLCSDVPRRYQQTTPLAGDIQEELLMHQLTYGHHFPVLVSLLSQTRAPEFAFFFLPGNLLLLLDQGEFCTFLTGTGDINLTTELKLL